MPIDLTREFKPISIAVLTISDSRSSAEDTSGDILAECVANAGHRLRERAIVKNSIDSITQQLRKWIADPQTDCVISTGGTGLTGRDVTPEAFARVWDKEIAGFGELFRYLSYQTIGTSMVQSRACAGVASETYLFALPGSPTAVRDGWEGILLTQLDSRHRPCNFVEVMPRLRET
jgi:molybdenum cofactor biosynthesis protein B